MNAVQVNYNFKDQTITFSPTPSANTSPVSSKRRTAQDVYGQMQRPEYGLQPYPAGPLKFKCDTCAATNEVKCSRQADTNLCDYCRAFGRPQCTKSPWTLQRQATPTEAKLAKHNIIMTAVWARPLNVSQRDEVFEMDMTSLFGDAQALDIVEDEDGDGDGDGDRGLIFEQD